MHRLRLTGFTTTIMAATMLAATGILAGMVKKPPPPPSEPIIWTGEVIATSVNWDVADDIAAAHEEGGYSDWRLPTVDEAIDAINDGSWGTLGTSNGTVAFWTSGRRGNRAYAYVVSFDNGVPIPETLEIRLLWWPTSYIDVKAVRP